MIYLYPARYVHEVLDYGFDFNPLLNNDEIITGRTVVADNLTVTKISDKAGVIYFWLSGGSKRTLSTITITVTTDKDRVIEVQPKINNQ